METRHLRYSLHLDSRAPHSLSISLSVLFPTPVVLPPPTCRVSTTTPVSLLRNVKSRGAGATSRQGRRQSE